MRLLAVLTRGLQRAGPVFGKKIILYSQFIGMARVRSPGEARRDPASGVHEIAEAGLGAEVYAKINDDFPHKGSLKHRTWHIWSSFLDWAIEFPEKRRASVQLNVSDLITGRRRHGRPRPGNGGISRFRPCLKMRNQFSNY